MKIFKITILLVLLVTAITFIFSCAENSEEDALKKLKATPLEKKAGDITFPSLNSGKTVSLSDYKGKLVMLSIWRSGCHYCQAEAPLMHELSKYVREDNRIVMLGVSIDKNKDEALDFLKTYNLSYENIWSEEVSNVLAARGYEIQGTPTTFFIDPNGNIVGEIVGYLEFDPKKKYEALVELYKAVTE